MTDEISSADFIDHKFSSRTWF